jgi:hypothetical protein
MKKLQQSGCPVYKTELTMCFFKPDSAECLKGRRDAERTRPITHRCEPLSCANSALIRLQVPAYLEDFEEYATLADDASQSSSQIELYRSEMAKLAAVIASFTPTLMAEREVLDCELEGADPREASTLARKQRRCEVDDLLRRVEASKVTELANA